MKKGIALSVAALAAASLLGACGGGGGGGDQDLYVEFNYDDAMLTAFAHAYAAPETWGLEEVSPHFEASGLPAGLSMDGATGAITGVPLQIGAFEVTGKLTVSGYAGSLSDTFTIAIYPLSPTYDRLPTMGLPLGLELGQPVGPYLPVLPPSLADGVTLHFSAGSGAAALPPGMVVDPDTGAITGAPTALSAGLASTLTLTTSYQGHVVEGSQSYLFAVNKPYPMMGYDYLGLQLWAKVGTPLSLASPSLLGEHLAGDSLSDFHLDPSDWHGDVNTLPPGLAFDPATGAVSGTPTTAGDYFQTVVATFHRGDYTAEVRTLLGFHVAEGP